MAVITPNCAASGSSPTSVMVWLSVTLALGWLTVVMAGARWLDWT